MKHFYDDHGVMQYEIDRDLLVELAKALWDRWPPDKHTFAAERLAMQDHAATLLTDYQVHRDMAGVGGCLSLAEWREKSEDSPVKAALKKLLFDFADKGFLYQEFLLVAHSAICEIQLYSQLR